MDGLARPQTKTPPTCLSVPDCMIKTKANVLMISGFCSNVRIHIYAFYRKQKYETKLKRVHVKFISIFMNSESLSKFYEKDSRIDKPKSSVPINMKMRKKWVVLKIDEVVFWKSVYETYYLTHWHYVNSLTFYKKKIIDVTSFIARKLCM